MGARYRALWNPDLRQPEREHRILAARKVKRALRPGEVVHHRDGDRWNNDPTNLLVLPSQSHHMVLEHLQRRRAVGVVALFPDRAFLRALLPRAERERERRARAGDAVTEVFDLAYRAHVPDPRAGQLVPLFDEM